MTKLEAIKSLIFGNVLTHTAFKKGEWVRRIPDGRYQFNNGEILNQSEFQRAGDKQFATGWTIVEDMR